LRVKICGVTRKEDLAAAVRAGADAVGFVSGFDASRRNLTLRRASELISVVPPLVQSVLVTTEGVLKENMKEVEGLCPDALQVYGERAGAGLLGSFRGTLIRPYFVGCGRDPTRESEGFDALLTTGHAVWTACGSGSKPDLGLCAEVRRAILPKPLILSGGLTPETVREAIRRVRPYAVDVSSGVESSPGVKDERKMAEFVRNAKGAGFA
jgi:phosphoribosylanthranilate isomerase